ncbi:MAG: hypothetical protein HOD92_00030 [Deltaproteobacteria bacterium]|jgi:hypothetical protein|nr:hypothetical protein [Deltaproteobacteria bacterium]MBT4526903.1 hypothetical protein [Deltaproteobacteria bacterium]
MKKLIFLMVIVLIACIAAIKLVPEVNDMAKENLPSEILTIIGEEPMNIFEKGLDKAKDVMNSAFD